MGGFKVRRQETVFVVPEIPTKNESIVLSNIDDQPGVRVQAVVIMSFKGRQLEEGKNDDPAKVIKQALAKTLVYYYPFAGRIRPVAAGNNQKLIVDCNNKGALFIEADANVTLEEIQTQILPPCPLLGELLYDVPGSSGIIGCPLLLFQVTRLLCGGYILAIRFNHTMCDMLGFMQFLYAMVELSRGAQEPSIMPVWQRELLCARYPPKVTCTHHEYEKAKDKTYELVKEGGSNMNQEGFFFGPEKIEAIRNHLPSNLRHSCSSFEVLCACVWRCRVLALQPDPEDIVQFSMTVSVRENNIIVLPLGYYGNSFVSPAITTKAKELMHDTSLAYALQLVKESRDKANEEYAKSMIDYMVMEGMPNYYKQNLSWMATNLTRKGLEFVDFGWGSPSYSGVPKGTSLVSTFTRFKDANKKDVIAVVLELPKEALLRFRKELGRFVGDVSRPIFARSRL